MTSPISRISPISDRRLDAELAHALAALPGAGARGEFQATVLARAEQAARRRAQLRRRALSVLAGACIAAVGLGVWSFQAEAARASRRAALIDEHRRLQGELDELRELAGRRAQIPLGGDASTDLYLDLTKIPAGSADGLTRLTTRSPE